MTSLFIEHKKAVIAAIIIGGVSLLILCVLAFMDWNLLRPVVARNITAKTGREAAIDGDLRVHLWSWNPSAQINGLTLKNPPWADRKMMFAAKQITVSLSLARLLRGQIVIPQIEMVEPLINLERDSKGRASWQLGTHDGATTDKGKPPKIPAIRRLLIKDGRLHVIDEIRHLRFGGSLVADDGARANTSAFKIEAKGSLNEKPFALDAQGGPLLNLDPQKPYSFSAHVTASDIKLEAQVTIAKPFDLGLLDIKLVISGKDLADVFYLTGLALPNTPRYRFAASLHVNGTTITGDDFSGRLGSSDLAGKIIVQTGATRPKLTAKLTSNTLNIVDLAPTLGHPVADKSETLAAAEGASSASAKAGRSKRASVGRRADADPTLNLLLLPDADLQVNRVRGMDADVTFRAGAVTAPKIPMKEVSFHVILDNGQLSVDPLSFVLDQGRFAGKVHIDARADVPETSIDMRVDDVDLSQFKTAAMKTSPLSGTLIGRLRIHGFGQSVHKLASTADGAMSLIIPQGEINEAIAELTGINLTRGLGLLLAKNETKTSIRCGVLDFQAQNGDLTAKSFFIDTTDVLITGRGEVHLDSEALNLALKGDPKKLRLTRLRSPITIKGTLKTPAVGIDAGELAKQGAVATALGTLLTPVAAVIAFIDPGRAKNKDCFASVTDARESIHN